MNKNWVNLPSGKIINLANIAFIEPMDSTAKIVLVGPTVVTLDEKDSLPFLQKIGTHALAD
jgi:hypothetical protein